LLSTTSKWKESVLCSTLNDVRTLTTTNNAEFGQTIASIDEIIARMAVLDERAKAA